MISSKMICHFFEVLNIHFRFICNYIVLSDVGYHLELHIAITFHRK